MSTTPLIVGFLIDEKNELPAWECLMLKELLIAEYISEVVLIIIPVNDDEPNLKHESLGFSLFNRFENAWFNKIPDASSVSSLNEIENHYGILKRIKMASEINAFPVEIDLVYLSYKLKNLTLFNPPHYGIWQVGFGNVSTQTNLPGFWEVMRHETITEARLMVNVDESTFVHTAYHAIALTVPFSVKNNFNSIAFKASQFLPARLRELYLTGPIQFFLKYGKMPLESIPSNKIKSLNPGSFLMFWLFSQNVFLYLVHKIKKLLKKEIFIILYTRGKLEINSIDIENYTKLLPPSRTFWADPFVIKKEDDHFIFFEEGSYPEWKGRLAVIKINSTGVCSEKKLILEKPYHLSYPFIFEMNRNYYLIPESSANKTVDLYHCKNFPNEWEFSRNLLKEVVLQDSTIFYFQNTWWLFATTKSSAGSTSNDQLMIYYSSDIFSGEWHSHVGNPVITDVSNCRPAGKIFIEDERIFRPAQNNASRQYGYSIRINEIEILTHTEFKEKMIKEISPMDFPKYVAIHTINADENMIVIDGIMADSR